MLFTVGAGVSKLLRDVRQAGHSALGKVVLFMVVRRVAAVLSVGVLGLGVLGACSGGEADDSPSQSSSPSDPTSSPTAEESEEPPEPEVPEAMDQANKAGAKAFVEYYWNVVNYAQATGDTKLLKELAFETCEPCRNGVEGVDEIYSAGGRISGGEITVAEQQVKLIRMKQPRLFSSEFTLRFAQQVVIPRAGAKHERKAPSQASFSFVISQGDTGEWRVGQWLTS